MCQFFYLLLLFCLWTEAYADPLMIDLMRTRKANSPSLPRAGGMVKGFADCDPVRALPKSVFEANGVVFRGREHIVFVYPELSTAAVSLLLRPNSQELTSETSAGKLSVGAIYQLKKSVAIVPGVSIVAVGQMVNAVPPNPTMGVMYRFDEDAVTSLDRIEMASGAMLGPRDDKTTMSSVSHEKDIRPWFSVGSDDRTVWCWRHFQLAY